MNYLMYMKCDSLIGMNVITFLIILIIQMSILTPSLHSESTQTILSPTLGPMVLVPSGTLNLTSGATATLTQPFFMAAHPVTRSQFLQVMGIDPSDTRRSTGIDDPVQQVTWYQAIAFANKASIVDGLTPVYRIEGVDFAQLRFTNIPTQNNALWNRVSLDPNASGYRLPTEIEWLWAAGGAEANGSTKAFAGSDSTNNPRDYLWYSANAGGKTHPVGRKLPNELGLYDMSGNVWEWVWDWYGPLPTTDVVDYLGPETGTLRTHKGGAWNFDLSDASVASRDSLFPFYRHSTIGFRLMLRNNSF